MNRATVGEAKTGKGEKGLLLLSETHEASSDGHGSRNK